MKSPRKNIYVLFIIAGVAITLAAVSYQFSIYSSNQITDVAAKDVQDSSRAQAHDLSRILINKVEAVNNNLRVVSKSPTLQDPINLEAGKRILGSLQDTTKELTSFYMWLDSSGHMVWISNINASAYQQYKGIDLSYRSYFTEPQKTHEIYYSSAIVSNDNVPRIYISQPILDEKGNFNGIIVGAIPLATLGKYLQGQLSPDSQGSVGMMDRDGVVLYSDDLTLLGQNVFAADFQKKLPDGIKPSFNSFLRSSLSGGSGLDDITFRGVTTTLAYETVNIDGKDFAVIYISATHNVSSTIVSLINNQRILSTILILMVGGLAIGMAFLILTWNKNLYATVKSKTQALEDAIFSLSEANSQLKIHDKMQTDFINIAAHELRTPIQPLLGAAEMLEEELQKGTENMRISKAEIDMIVRNAKRLERLSSDILEASRIETKTLILHKENVDISQKIKNVINDFKGSMDDNKKIGIVFKDLSVEPMIVEADKGKLYEVLSNLIRNAIKFTKEGIITITLENKDENVVVSIRDDGIGINTSMLPKLFTKFSTDSESGTGLGLYISKSIIEAHGGKIWAENNSDGTGATFTFYLPGMIKQEKNETV